MNFDYVQQLPETSAEPFQIKEQEKSFCEPCVVAKQRKKPSKVPAERVRWPDQRIHLDLCGGGYTLAPKELQKTPEFEDLPISVGGAKFFMVITDDCSRLRKAVPLRHKHETEEAVKDWILEFEAAGIKTESIRLDEGTEFGSKKFNEWRRQKGIQLEPSASYTPKQNGLAERSIDLVCQKARSLLLTTDLPLTMWAEAVITATYLLNRSPTRVLARGQTPYQIFYGKKPPILHIRVFGCAAYAKIPSKKVLGKMAPRSKKMRLMGYASTNIYRLWDPEKRRIELVRDVVFNETDTRWDQISTPTTPTSPTPPTAKNASSQTGTQAALDPSPPPQAEETVENLTDIAREALNLIDLSAIEEGAPAPVAAAVRSHKVASNVPKTYAQAMRHPDAPQYMSAMTKQIKILLANNTWIVIDLQDLPSGAKVLSSTLR